MPNPSQSPRKPFPAWRLRNGVINATDGELEASSEACERWAWRSGGVLLAGLLIELAIAWAHPPYDSFWDRYGGVIADAFVVIGVGAEIQFGRMGKRRDDQLSRRSKLLLSGALRTAGQAALHAQELQVQIERMRKEAGEANERAAKLENDNLLLREAASPREFEQSSMAHLLKPYAGVSVKVIVGSPDMETRETAAKIRWTLQYAGWVRDEQIPLETNEMMRWPLPGIAIFSQQGHDTKTPIGEAARALINVLNDNKMETMEGWPLHPSGAQIVVLVKQRPLPKALRQTPDEFPSHPAGIKIFGNMLE